MTYEEFKNKYNGKYIDYDKHYGNQCWDLAEQYFVECLGLPASVLSGCGLVSNMLYQPKRAQLDKYFDEVDVRNMYPGDVCIWEYGHIAIFDNWDGVRCWYFSQNYPLGSNCHLQVINEGGLHAFRLKTKAPEVTPNVERDEYKNQIEVKVDNLRVRNAPSTKAKAIGHAKIGYYNFYETKEADGYMWYNIAGEQWIASNDGWTTVLPAIKPVSYQAHIEGDGWQDWKYDGEMAGTTDKAKRLEAIRIKCSKEVYAKAHIEGDGWVDYGEINEDTVIGTTGEAKRLECLCLKGDFKYRVHLQDTGWTCWTEADGVCTLGSVGQSLRIEAIEIKEI